MEVHVYLEPREQPGQPLILLQTDNFRVVARKDDVFFEYASQDSLGHQIWVEFENAEIAVNHFFTEVVRQAKDQVH